MPKAPLGEMSNGKVPQRLKAAMNMRMALDGVVPTSWVAAAKAAFSSGKTFAHLEFVSTALVLLGIPKYYPVDRIAHLIPWGRRKTDHFVAE